MTLVEVLIAVALVSAAAAIVYHGTCYSYKTVMRSRARLDAQGIAFDKLWEIFNKPLNDLPDVTVILPDEPTPVMSVFSDKGTVSSSISPETNAPINWIEYWEIRVQVWAPTNSPLFSVINPDGTVTAAYEHPLADYTVLRYRGDR